MDYFFVSEFQYTEECIPEYLKRWWRENLIVSYILTALVFLYFFLMLIIRRNLVYLFLELLPILLLLLIRVKVSRAIKIEKERYQVNYRNTVPLMHIEIGQDILYRIEAVSYTHLDVYKRQMESSCPRRLRGTLYCIKSE